MINARYHHNQNSNLINGTCEWVKLDLQNSLEYREFLFFKLITIIDQSKRQAQKNNTRYKLHLLLNHLQENCFDEYDWHTIAQHFHLTLTTMFRHIKQAIGLALENDIKHLRLLSTRSKICECDIKLLKYLFIAVL